MTHIKPFRALRPDPRFATVVASRPYDVMNRSEAREEAQGKPFSFLHVTRSEIDLPEQVSIYDDAVYRMAKSNLEAFVSREVLFTESKACYYLYRLTMQGRKQTGLVCVSSVDDYNNGVIKKHEFTRPEKEQDRIRHIVETGAQTGNVFLAYRQVAEMDALVAQWQANRSPVYDFVADDGVQHEIWVVNNDEAIENITRIFQEQVPCTYIADGHHRAASAAKSRASFSGAAAENADWFLTTLFPADQLHIMDYNRVVTDLNGHTVESFLQAISQSFDCRPAGQAPYAPQSCHEFGMYVGGQWYALTARPGTFTDDVIGILDVTILQNNILKPMLGVEDPRTDKRIDFVGGIRGLAALQERVDNGSMAVAFSLYPVTIQQLFEISDHGEVMPPKSTWFEPKLRDGLLTHVVAQNTSAQAD